MANDPKITFSVFRIQEGTTKTIEAAFSCGLSYVKEYSIRWWYKLNGKEDIAFVGEETTNNWGNVYWTVPDNTTKATLQVKPVSDTYKNSNGDEVNYWEADWAPNQSIYFVDAPLIPATLTVEINDYKLTTYVDNISSSINADQIEFQIVKNDSSIYNTGSATIITNSASYSCTLNAGDRYKVRCRSKRSSDGMYSDWSEYSSNYNTIPSAPTKITICKASSETAIYLEWTSVSNALTYDIEYATKEEYFDGSDQTSVVSGTQYNHYEKTGLTSGEKYFFRVRAVNSVGESSYTSLASVIIGEIPSAPTTWSSTTNVIVGEDLTLYWVHNSEDGSSQTYAELELTINNVLSTYTIHNTTDENNKDKTSYLAIDTSGACNAFYNYTSKNDTSPIITFDSTIFKSIVSTRGLYTFTYDGSWKLSGVVKTLSDYGITLTGTPISGDSIIVTWSSAYTEGATIKWRVRTAGITKTYGDWSIQRIVDIYAPPTLTMSITDAEENVITTLTELPFYVHALAGPSTQLPISYYLTVKSNALYETVDSVGNIKMVNKDEIVYSKYFDTSDPLLVELSANNISLYNNVEYTVTCVVSMNSGLTVSASSNFTVSWVDDSNYFINAEIGFNKETCSTSIRPYCLNGSNTLISGISLSVYRHNYDGSFVELGSGLDNTKNIFITDPHPSLDYARYRVVAKTDATGHITYSDLPLYPIGENSIVIQWAEQWSSFDNVGDSLYSQPSWSGSMIKIPYNIDVSDNNDSDVSLVEYIGRKRPVSYYGTQLGEKSTWNVDIPKSDKELLYALRRLSIWMGDVYVREPSGSGYWANITVSFSQKHKNLVMPVIFNITRVEGGV